MWVYILRRILQAIPILIAVNILTFALFFFVNSPDDIARVHLGGKYITQSAVQDWKEVHGYHLPLFYNQTQKGTQKLTETIFFQKSVKLFALEFGLSDTDRDIKQAIKERYLPSIQLAIPVLFIGMLVNISFGVIISLV